VTTTLTLPTTDPLDAVKARQQAMWASGDFSQIGARMQIVGETLCEAADLRAGERVLDVAAGSGNAALAAARRFCEVTATDYVPELLEKGRRRAEAEGLPMHFLVADAEKLPFADGAFDVAYSNAVIEHVGGEERQRAFVHEAVRVGRRVFLTTPNRRFPVDVHTRLPFVHWLPETASGHVYDLVGKGWAKENRLLSAAELLSLFPVPVRIVNLGLTLVAIT
jgi:2-polyprenyl-3-methyl-5-hydroxy-6-metoxy-1,4-benzoquinol methylase